MVGGTRDFGMFATSYVGIIVNILHILAAVFGWLAGFHTMIRFVDLVRVPWFIIIGGLVRFEESRGWKWIIVQRFRSPKIFEWIFSNC